LKEELGEEEMRSVENVEVVPLPCNSPDLQHRIVYAVAQAKQRFRTLNESLR